MMNEAFKSLDYYWDVYPKLKRCNNIPEDFPDNFLSLIYEADDQNRFSKPMKWIGSYIALASLFCILPMVADLFHGFQKRKFWFPCKYFTLNAASLTVIAIAMKLPVDLNNSMPGPVDQAAKIGSMAFLCSMMANLLPSLATMDNKGLLTNILALGVFVITLIVNVCIQIKTGVVLRFWNDGNSILNYISYFNRVIALLYVVMLLMLLIMHTCSALMIVKSKEILESKYQAGHETALKELDLQQPGRERLTAEKLKQHVSNHQIMAESGSPQFITACSITTCASGVICVLCTLLHVAIMVVACVYFRYYGSDYQWSIPLILILQFTGSLVASVSPLCRCFASLSFKLSMKWFWNHIKVFKVERYWTQKLSDWKQSSLRFSISSRVSKFVIHSFKNLILNICIGFQTTVIVLCKMTMLIPVFFVICVFYCIQCWKWIKAKLNAWGIILVKKPLQPEDENDRCLYVLQLQDDMELAEKTLERITKSVDHLIEKAEKLQPKNLMKLLEKSRNFKGVEKFNSLHVPPLPAEEYLNCWSVTLVTLTTIAMSLSNIKKDAVDGLSSGVSEGLVYVTHVEETLNATDGYQSIQKAAKNLWLEVEVYGYWLGNKLQKFPPNVKTAKQILQWFTNTAKKTVVIEGDIRYSNDDIIFRSFCANSMYRITETLLLSYEDNVDEVSQEELFENLSSMIGDILAACLTNLPQVIVMKCHSSVIEKREASFQAAAQLLGETMPIINNLNDREIPSLNTDELPFIDKWYTCLNRSVL